MIGLASVLVGCGFSGGALVDDFDSDGIPLEAPIEPAAANFDIVVINQVSE